MKDIIDIENRRRSPRIIQKPCGIFEHRCYDLANSLMIDNNNKRKKTIYELDKRERSYDVAVKNILM